ncbi:MAG: hypothetical protein D6719_05375 [Candidatus Dadabacteria bacterium]|nr:MAG: hypothetical protein D6719_05375 [Candidatus Dadabacteria bacterium]
MILGVKLGRAQVDSTVVTAERADGARQEENLTGVSGTLPAVDLDRDIPQGGQFSDREKQSISNDPFQGVRTNRKLLSLGKSGVDVFHLQEDLNKWLEENGKERINVNGIYDQATVEAVKEFQRSYALSIDRAELRSADSEHGLAVDGIVGPRTMRALDLYLKRNTLDFNTFKEVTGGIWDKSQARLGYEHADGFNYWREHETEDIRVNFPGLEEEFYAEVERVAAKHGMNPNHLMAVMQFETVGSFDPSKKNPHSSATGLIQFMEATAQELGTTTAELRRMNRVEQMEYVDKYFSLPRIARPLGRVLENKGRLDLEDVYLAVLSPANVGKDPDEVVFRAGTEKARVNPVFGDGDITVGRIAQRIGAGSEIT